MYLMNSNSKLSLIFMICYSVFIMGCGHAINNESEIENKLIGEWQSNPESIFSMEFTKEGVYNKYYNGNLETQINFRNNVYNQLYYELVKTDDGDRLLIYGKNPKAVLLTYKIEIQNGRLYLVSFKTLNGIKHHFDEYSSYSKKGMFKSNNEPDKPTIKVIFPNNYKGLALVAFGEEKGRPQKTDSENIKVLRIPPDGILKTQSKPNAFAILRKEVAYFMENSHGELEEIELTSKIQSIGEQNIESLDSNKIYIVNYGFNQIDRERVNSKLFKSEVNNNVLFLGVGTPSELSEIWNQTIESIQ